MGWQRMRIVWRYREIRCIRRALRGKVAGVRRLLRALDHLRDAGIATWCGSVRGDVDVGEEN